MRAEAKVVQITDKQVISRGTCWDLENNVATAFEVRAVKDNELEVIREFFLKRKIDKDIVLMDKLRTVHTDKLIEISFPTTV